MEFNKVSPTTTTTTKGGGGELVTIQLKCGVKFAIIIGKAEKISESWQTRYFSLDLLSWF